MRKTIRLLLLLGAMFLSHLSFAQTKVISGQIKNAKGEAIPFVTVTETGTNNSAAGDANGYFSIKIKPDGSLTFSAVGYNTKTIKGDGGAQSVTLDIKPDELKEVVISTAFGIKKSARVSPYSSQVLTSEQLRIIPQTNVNSALAGKIAGTQFRGQSAIKLDNDGGFRVRGGQGLTDNGPIYVVDGTIVGSFDLNPDDIGEVNFLKGANATALLGDRAANGAIIITTKKSGGKSGTGIEVSQGVTFDKVYILPKYQNLYAGGADKDLSRFTWLAGMPQEWQALDGKYYHEYTDDASWGPRMVGQEYIPWYAWFGGHDNSFKTAKLTPFPDNARDFWATGITTVSNISLTKSGPGYSGRLSYTNNTIKGMLPNTRSEKHSIFGTFSLDLNEHFRTGMNINFVNQKIKGSFNDDYSNQSSGSFNQWFHRDLDMEMMRKLSNARTPIGTLPSWNLRSNPGGSVNNVYIGNYWYNFFSYFENLDYKQLRDRLYGDVFLQYKINKNLNVKATIRKSLLNTSYENIVPSIIEASAGQTGTLAGYATGQRRIDEMNYELLASYSQKFLNKLDVSVNAGANWMRFKDSRVDMSTTNGLNVPDLYAISNSKGQPSLNNARIAQEQRSVFATGDFEWDKTVSFSWALRNDWNSTLPAGNNSLLSPALGAGFIFSEFTKESISWLSFGKVFGSWGKKPTSLTAYQNNFLYSVNQNQWNGNFLIATPNTLVDPSVKGALITTIEAGLDLRFLKNRLGVNFVYYWEDIDKAPVSVSVYGGSGFTSKVVNAAHIQRKGIEVVLNAKPIVQKSFEWEINKTFGYLINNPVLSIADGVPRFTLAQSAFTIRVPQVFLEEGKQWGQLIGGAIKRNADGLPLLSTTGMFLREDNHNYGSVVPKITGGIINSFTYKKFTLGFNIDYQIGGKFFSLSEMWGHYSGLLEATAAVNDKGKNVRDDIGDGGGVHVVGVAAADGKTAVDYYVDAQTYWHQFYNNVYDPYVHDLTYVKLREISLGYEIPVNKMKLGNVIRAARISAVSRNPWLIYRDSKNFDPSEISEVQGEDGQYPGSRSIGFNLKLTF